jgi:hypothetical protein
LAGRFILSDHERTITLIRTSCAIFVCLFTIVCLIANQFKALFVWLHSSAATILDFGFDRGPGAKIHRSLARNIPPQICYGFPRPLQSNYKKFCAGKIPRTQLIKLRDDCAAQTETA